jgi:hypothetical protein
MSEQNSNVRENDKKPQGVLSDVGSNPTPGANNIAKDEPRCFGLIVFTEKLGAFNVAYILESSLD